MAVKLRVLAVDDEKYIREELVYLLSALPEVEVVGEAADVPAALALIRDKEPDALFLDIQLPGANGLELANWLRELPRPPLVVFTTAYPQYAVDAFAVSAVDYLLKPYTRERVAKAVRRLQVLTGGAGEEANTPRAAAPAEEAVRPSGGDGRRQRAAGRAWEKIAVPRPDGYALLSYEEICWLEFRGGVVYLHTPGESFLVPGSLRTYEVRLNGHHQFQRIHRHLLVNLEHVKEVLAEGDGTYSLVMDDKAGTILPVSRPQSKKLRAWLHL
jgi:DNA-binding LytR/AlgR family response regulator